MPRSGAEMTKKKGTHGCLALLLLAAPALWAFSGAANFLDGAIVAVILYVLLALVALPLAMLYSVAELWMLFEDEDEDEDEDDE